MPTGYYIHKPKTEWEAVERWENEGGRLGQIMAVNEKAKSITGRDSGRGCEQTLRQSVFAA